jgi:hypothetical protein
MDSLPGYKNIRVAVKMKAAADDKTLQEIHQKVVNTAPVGLTITRPVKVEATLATS